MNRPLRFCMVTTFYPPDNFGGDGIFVERLTNELARRGHRVDVVYSPPAYRILGGPRRATAAPDHPNVTRHPLDGPLGMLRPLATHQLGAPLLGADRLRRILDQAFDVVHFHNVSLVGGPGILRYGRGVKLYTMHEYWLVCPTHVLFKFNRAPCVRRQCLPCVLAHRRPPQAWRYTGLLPRATRHVDAFIAPSRFSLEEHRRLGLRGRIVQIPYFLPDDPDDEAQASPGPPRPYPYFLAVGRLERIKGFQTIIPLFRRYPKARLLIAGSGGLEGELRRLAAGSPNVEFLGFQSGRSLEALYRHAIALIVPSITYEVAPQVILEAFRQGTPAIVRDLGGMPELVETGGGFIYRTDAELIAALDRLVADPALRCELGARSERALRREWTAEPHLRRYFDLIEELGGSATAGRH